MKSSSWRSGVVCSAVAAGVSVPHIMAMGRWSSRAWMAFLLQAPPDLQSAARSMWLSGQCLALATLMNGLSVAEFDVGGCFAADEQTGIVNALAHRNVV